MKILVTGSAGFIGYHLVKSLCKDPNIQVTGIDSINDYYSVSLKYARLEDCGISEDKVRYGELMASTSLPNYHFMRLDLCDATALQQLFANEHFDTVCNLAGQPGVRYSIENPASYIQSNIVGFFNILECCRHEGVKHLLYASSSSIYGNEHEAPFKENFNSDRPYSLYAATKKSDEEMAFAYSHLYGFATTGLRFFTVYGPWGRPDMAPIKFMRAIMEGRQIDVYNHGNMFRDFTYIDDIIQGIMLIIKKPLPDNEKFHIYNIGESHPIQLLHFINVIEKVTGRKAKMNMMGMQPGDVEQTYADISKIQHDYGYHPHTTIEEGITALFEWLKTMKILS